MLVSVTELHIKDFFSLIKFIPHAIRSNIQVAKAEGILVSKVSSKGLLIQQTLTCWKDQNAMLNYMRSGAHKDAMKIFPNIANTSYTYRYESEHEPTWAEALEKLKTHGRALG